MRQRPLGDSGLHSSHLALGTWAMGGDIDTWGPVDDRESIATLEKALDLGITMIDTAPIYGKGHSEEIVGRAILGQRDRVVIATKCGLLFPTTKDGLPPRCLTKKSVIQECENSLRRLQIDVIDLYQCHWPDPNTPIQETMEAMNVLLDQGKIRAIGLSNYNCERISQARNFGPVHAVQPPFSMLQRRAMEDLIPYCMEYGIAVLPYSPLSRGLLTGKFDSSSRFEDIRSKDPDFLGDRYRRNLDLVEHLRPIADRYQKSVAQLAINWTAYYPGITTPIVGAKRPSQMMENAGGVGWELSEMDRQEIDSLLDR